MAKKDIIEGQVPEKRKRCYIQARNFFYAAKRCGRLELCEESGSHQVLIIPEYVNIAFSCELYLKAVLYRDEEIIREHKLLDLFNKLDITLKDRVAEILNTDKEQIDILLEKYTNLFTKMRYSFEKPQYNESFSVPLDFFYKMAESLDILAQEIIGVEPYPSTNVNIDLFNDLSLDF